MRASTVDILKLAAENFAGPVILNGGYDAPSARLAIESDDAEAVSFASLYIANPDLVERFRCDYSLSETDPRSIYSPTREGYGDYPAFPS